MFYVCFATIAVSYAKTYRIKNSLINYIEQHQLSFSKSSNTNNAINEFLDKNGYSVSGDSVVTSCQKSGGTLTGNKGGACIEEVKLKNNSYYRVSLYIPVKLPVFSTSFVFPVGGETEDYSRKYNINVP